MTEPYYADATVTVHAGDCLDVLRAMPDASVDAVVTDPPYGLEFMGKDWDSFGDVSRANRGTQTARKRPEGESGTSQKFQLPAPAFDLSPTARLTFQTWCEEWSWECLRVLKPGGHLLAFGGTRTWHRLACAIEDAGFEVRDSIAWLYASGFPKSLDVSKAIDKRAEVNTETQRRIALVAEVIRTHREAKGMERAEVSLAVVGTPSGACWNWEHQQLPSVEMWPAIKATLGIPDEFDGLIEGDRAQFIAAERAVIRERTGAQAESTGRFGGWGNDDGTGRSTFADTAPATDAARTWQGWGSAMKPGFEPVVVARKPLIGTIAANVLAHGTGALNIDGCRIGTDEALQGSTVRNDIRGGNFASGHRANPGDIADYAQNPAGRWPANVVLDEHAARELDQQSGDRPGFSGGGATPGDVANDVYGKGWQRNADPTLYGDSGGASRFYFTTKAATDERVRVAGVAHPTVKPLALMRWLVRLVTPPGGTVLEPFAGSGTTVEACILEGFRCIAIEREADYLPLIVQRINRRRDPVAAVRDAGDDGGLFDLLAEEPA